MCILSFLPREAELDDDALWNGAILNPDGHGWAIASRDGIIMGRSLNPTEAIEGYAKARTRHDGPSLFHSRWATHGSIKVDNCHPFLVGGSHKTVVAHNGVLPRDAHPRLGDDRSDTRIFADKILPRQYRRLDRPRVANALTQWCGSGNKLIILTVDRRYARNVYLIGERQGHWDTLTGAWHSNYDYLASKWISKGSIGYGSKYPSYIAADDYEKCLYCGYGDVGKSGFCLTCQTCQDCCENRDDCLCWVRMATAQERLADEAQQEE